MTVSSPTGDRRTTTQAEFWRRRAIVVLAFATVASAPFLLAAEPTAEAAPAAPEPVRAVAAKKEAPRIAAGPSAASIPRAALPPRRVATAEALLTDPRIVLSDNAAADLRNGLVDARLVALLAHMTKTYDVELTVLSTGHGRFVKGTNKVSNHIPGRAVDISAINGEDVTSANAAARRFLQELLTVDADFRPNEIGGPWDIDDAEPVGFTDSGHRSHLHIGFDS